MIGVGIDRGASQVKAVALQRFEDGSYSILEALVLPAGEPARVQAGLASLAKHRPTAFTRPPAVVSVNHPDQVVDRARLPLPADSASVTDMQLRAWILEGRVPVTVPLLASEDLWDLKINRLFRRAADVETLGGKFAEVTFARLPRGFAEASPPPPKPLVPSGIEPGPLSLMNALLAFGAMPKGQPVLLIDAGLGQMTALLVADGTLLRATAAHADKLLELVANTAKLPVERADQRIRDADFAATDSVDTALRAALTKALQQIQKTLWGEGSQLPKPQRVTLTGGFTQVRGLTRLVNQVLELPAETFAQPERLRTTASLPAPFPLFAPALGAALRAAGAAPLAVQPERQSLAAIQASATAQHVTVPGVSVPAGPPPSGLAQLGDMLVATAVALRHIPRRLGWAWIAVGAAAFIALGPTLYALSQRQAQVAKYRRDILLADPDLEELERQGSMIGQYVSLMGTGVLTVTPWGEILNELARRMPENVFVAQIGAGQSRVVLQARAKGNPSRTIRIIVNRLKASPLLRQQGLAPGD